MDRTRESLEAILGHPVNTELASTILVSRHLPMESLACLIGWGDARKIKAVQVLAEKLSSGHAGRDLLETGATK